MTSAPGFIAVPIESFRSLTRDINFDVYLKVSDENIAHVFARSTGLDYKRLAGYIQKGVSHLFIREEDKVLYEAFISRSAESIFTDPNTTREKKIATLLNMTEQNMAEVFSQVIVREETAQDTQKLVRSYVDLMTQNPQSLATILMLVSHGEYLYYHSIAVSIFSLFIAKASGQFNRETMEKIGLGGFLHDIGSTQLSKELVCTPGEYTSEEQFVEMRTHCKLGLAMLSGNPKIPEEVRFIVYQHHEQPSGQGYPNRMHDSKIFYPAKVVALADAFSALISKRPWRPAYTPEQAIKILRDEKGKRDPELVEILAGIILRPAAASSIPPRAA